MNEIRSGCERREGGGASTSKGKGSFSLQGESVKHNGMSRNISMAFPSSLVLLVSILRKPHENKVGCHEAGKYERRARPMRLQQTTQREVEAMLNSRANNMSSVHRDSAQLVIGIHTKKICHQAFERKGKF